MVLYWALHLVLWGATAQALLLLALIKLPKPIPERWQVKLFILQSMPAPQFLRLVVENGVDPVFDHRAFWACYLSCMNWLFWIPQEEKRFPTADILATEIRHPPIFIVGHYRCELAGPHGIIRPTVLLAGVACECRMDGGAYTNTHTHTHTHTHTQVGHVPAARAAVAGHPLRHAHRPPVLQAALLPGPRGVQEGHGRVRVQAAHGQHGGEPCEGGAWGSWSAVSHQSDTVVLPLAIPRQHVTHLTRL
jgi:hypothetical protein